MKQTRSNLIGATALGLAGLALTSPSSAIAAETERKVTVGGHVNKALVVTDDGDNEYVDFSDNLTSVSRFHIEGTSTGGGRTAGARIQFGLTSNNGQDQTENTSADGGGTLDVRNAYVWFESEKWGRIILGKAETASDGITEADLSGTDVSSYNGGWPIEGYYFLQSGQKAGTTAGSTTTGAANPVITDVLSNFSGDGRQDLIRYTSPVFKGFELDLSATEGGGVDGAIRYAGKFYNTAFNAAFGAVNTEGRASTGAISYGGSISGLHDSGLNATFSWAESENQGYADARNLYAKLGYIVKVFGPGETRLSVSWQRSTDVADARDQATAIGLQAVQILDGYGTEIYAGYSNFELDRNGVSFEDIDAGWVGARVTF